MATTLQNNNETKEIAKSHELASDIRKLYGLEPITEKQPNNVIKDLHGLLKDFVDNEESSVDAVKAARENLS